GDTDNASFQIVGDVVRTTGSFDFEGKSSYTVRIRTTDPYGNSFEKLLTINATNVNEAPTGVGLAAATVSEGAPVGTVVGALTAADPDAGDTATFALVAGEGDADNVSFTIEGNQIRTATRLNFEARQSYSVRVRVTDAGGLSTEGVLTITVQDVTDEPLVVEGVTPPVAGSYAAGRRVRFAITLSEVVQVLGKPKLQLQVGRSSREAVYVAGNGSAVLTFEYVVGPKDSAEAVSLGRALVLGKKAGIAAGAEKLTANLPSGIAGAVAAGVRFDAAAPRATGRVGTPANGTYAPGQALDFVVRFSEAVIVAGPPQIAISGFNAARQAIYVSGSGSASLTFRYLIQSGDAIRGTKGLRLAKAIALVGGATITDQAGNRATIQITSQPLKGIRLGAAPAIATIERAMPDGVATGTRPRVRATFAVLG
ncbi:MAG: cadherin repeat domain-containing protein, partial [Planctomycetaceae bacterium]